MTDFLKNKTILVTGGAGSVGRALIKKILKHDVKTIRIFDSSENEMFKIESNFRNEERLRYLIGDIRNLNRLRFAMEGIDIVIHLAAMKHVYTCEYNPFEAIETNIQGLQNVISVARNENVQKVIFSSTDKAAHPLNVMGMTKLIGEKLMSLADYYRGDKRTLFSSVRFGNVMGSNGSVIPLFKKQIKEGGPVTITDKKMTRFVITMDEAVNLICNVVKFTKGGETFVPKMKILRVVDLAETMIKKYNNGKKIKIVVTGKIEGEKIHEDLMSEEELSRAVKMGNLYVIFPMVDYTGVRNKHRNVKTIKNPIIVSNAGKYMSREKINKLLEEHTDI